VSAPTGVNLLVELLPTLGLNQPPQIVQSNASHAAANPTGVDLHEQSQPTLSLDQPPHMVQLRAGHAAEKQPTTGVDLLDGFLPT
jgi:hypothetical protein